MNTKFTKGDLDFLKSVGIADDTPSDSLTTEQLMDAALQTVRQMSPQEKAEVRKHLESDGTVRLLEKWGIPVNRENYLMLAFAGHPPQEPLDGEIEAELPEELQRRDEEEES